MVKLQYDEIEIAPSFVENPQIALAVSSFTFCLIFFFFYFIVW